MERSDFQGTLLLAIRGNRHATARILAWYTPLIEHASTVAGRQDEDLKQFIYLRVIAGLRKFRI